mmetsp:Transcript_32647/g.75896  ORF Transcript_32647/g.75896 Transcript_32647/m.75896 type:complete len:132 (+) Transcript_32647:101-496(+)
MRDAIRCRVDNCTRWRRGGIWHHAEPLLLVLPTVRFRRGDEFLGESGGTLLGDRLVVDFDVAVIVGAFPLGERVGDLPVLGECPLDLNFAMTFLNSEKVSSPLKSLSMNLNNSAGLWMVKPRPLRLSTNSA